MTQSRSPSPAQLVGALQRLDADLIAGWVVADDEVREHLRDRIKRIQARVAAEARDRYAQDQEEAVAVMLALLDNWPPAANDLD